MNTRPIPTRPTHSGFSLVELMVVVVLMGIVAISVIPAMGNVQSMRNGAARDDAVRLLELAKARALATGMPNGIQINLNTSSLTLVHLTEDGDVESVIDPLTYQVRSITLPVTYSGVTVGSMVNGDGESGSGIIWFDYEANPHTREQNGDFAQINQEPALIELSSDETLLVHAYTGVIELR